MTECVIIRADKHTGETHDISLKEKYKGHVQKKRFYPVRNKDPHSEKRKIARKTRGGTPLCGKPNRRPATTPEFSPKVHLGTPYGGVLRTNGVHTH